ncbi:MAG: hypothetical protein ACPGVG_13775 [Mycobacterium sp.]
MTTANRRGPVKALGVVTYLAMIVVNVPANALPFQPDRGGKRGDRTGVSVSRAVATGAI